MIVYVRARERVHTRRSDVWLVGGCRQHPPWLDECALCMFNGVGLSPSDRICCRDGWLNNVTPRSVILLALICKCTDCVLVSERRYLPFIQLIALLSARSVPIIVVML